MINNLPIIDDFESFLNQRGGNYEKFCVGITNDPGRRLHDTGEHNVSKLGEYLYKKAGDAEAARQIEKYFIDQGCTGGTGGGDENSEWVYIYLKTSHTRP